MFCFARCFGLICCLLMLCLVCLGLPVLGWFWMFVLLLVYVGFVLLLVALACFYCVGIDWHVGVGD